MFPSIGLLHLDFALRTPKQRCDFLDPYFSLKTHLHHFPTWRAYVFLKLKFRFFFFFFFFFFAVHCVVEALSFYLNHYLTLVSKQNSVEDPQKAQNSFLLNWNYKRKPALGIYKQLFCGKSPRSIRYMRAAIYFSVPLTRIIGAA